MQKKLPREFPSPGGRQSGQVAVKDMSDVQTDDKPDTQVPRYTRRTSDKILVAFHYACDQGDLEVAEQLLAVLEMAMPRQPTVPNRRRDDDSLVSAHERLWALRHPVVEEL